MASKKEALPRAAGLAIRGDLSWVTRILFIDATSDESACLMLEIDDGEGEGFIQYGEPDGKKFFKKMPVSGPFEIRWIVGIISAATDNTFHLSHDLPAFRIWTRRDRFDETETYPESRTSRVWMGEI